MNNALNRAHRFANDYGLACPVLLAPMAGACPPSLSVAVMQAGGMGACGALLMDAIELTQWVSAVRDGSSGTFQINTWIPDPIPVRDLHQEEAVAHFLSRWGPSIDAAELVVNVPDFEQQCHRILQLRPRVVSSIMGLYDEPMRAQLRDAGIAWFATVTSVAEAVAAEAAGADAVVAQGMEAGGHRGSFVSSTAEAQMAGLFSLLPIVVDAVSVPVVATGGIADSRGVAAALMLGASAVQLGTAFLRAPEANIPKVWADALADSYPEDTCTTRSFSGRLGRSLKTPYVSAANLPTAPEPLPYPTQRSFTAAMRNQAIKESRLETMQAWAGQSACLAKARPAGEIVYAIWDGVPRLFD